ncbi:hypothetical protein V2J92_22185 [Pseudomonas alliivorans]|nr:hypothetical protein [Pseudomonas alliivorans]MEE5171551.1 hypothetical protein [Pseudomonas alliivorans]
MWKLQVPKNGKPLVELTTALDALKTDPANALQDSHIRTVLAAYKQYNKVRGNPCRTLEPAGINKEQLATLKAAYTQVQEGKALSALRNYLKLNAKICPYCGFLPITDLDHFLPKSKYELFSIHAPNLVPCCSICNTKKSTLAGSTSKTQFSHTYFASLPKQRFLRAVASMRKGALVLNFEIIRTSGLGNEEFERLKYQFDQLQLNERYKKAVNDYLAAHKDAITAQGKIGPRSVRYLLLKTFRTTSAGYGPNHWYSSVWHALYLCEGFYNGGYSTAFGQRKVNKAELA